MYRDRGIVLKIIPYSDSAAIIRCFTHTKGVIALFTRYGKKTKQAGHLQTGAFIEFTAQPRPNALLSVRDCHWDRNVPNTSLHPSLLATWLFTVELLHKALAEDFALPHLKTQVDTYYAHLLHEAISPDPCTPLILISSALGLFDPTQLAQRTHKTVVEDLRCLGYSFSEPAHIHPSGDQKTLFEAELNRFMQHFGIQRLDACELL